MDLKDILKLFGCEHLPGDGEVSGFLGDAVANFSVNPTSSTSVIRQLQAKDPSRFALAAVRLLVAAGEKSPGLQYIIGLVTAGNLLIEPLMDERILTLEAAAPLARKVAAVEPLLDVHLIRKMIANARGDVSAIESPAALHVLGLVSAISDCSRLTSYLVQFLRHPSSKVRSKAALLLGQANWNLGRLQSFLAADDGRLRASAVESIWKHRERDVFKILWESTRDPFGRVVVNALLGLCHVGDRDAYARVVKLAEATDPLLRSGAAWAMGETGDAGFAEALQKLEQESHAKVRAMAEKSRKKLSPLPASA